MAYKFFNIGKANEEISRLEAENARITAELQTATDNATAVAGQCEQLTTDIGAARQSIETLTKANGTLTESVTSITAERDGLKAKIANPGEQVTAAAAQQAAVITASIGIPPLEIKGTAANPATEKPKTELKGRDRYNAAIKIEGQPNTQTT